MPKSPLNDSGSTLANVAITSNGTAIDDTIAVTVITITTAIDKPAVAEIGVMIDGIDPGQFDTPGNGFFKKGSVIEIGLSYDGNSDIVFRGMVTNYLIATDAGASISIKVVCHNTDDAAIKPPYDTFSLPLLELTYGESIIRANLNSNGNKADELNHCTGQVSCPGTALAKVNTMVRLRGLGKNFSSDVFVSGVTHLVSNGNWTTTITVGIA